MHSVELIPDGDRDPDLMEPAMFLVLNRLSESQLGIHRGRPKGGTQGGQLQAQGTKIVGLHSGDTRQTGLGPPQAT